MASSFVAELSSIVDRSKDQVLVLELLVETGREEEDDLVEPVRLVLHDGADGPGAERRADGDARVVGVRHGVAGRARSPRTGSRVSGDELWP